MSHYARSLEALYSLVRVGEKYGLDGPRGLEQSLGYPLESFDSVLVGGTNGKGSTSAALSQLLRSGGSKVGLFTSPHLVTFRERIRIDGTPISEAEAARLIEMVLPLAERRGCSFFETTWAMAALAFAEANVDIVVWEVGLGGRLDATNVCEPLGAIVTNVALDHTAILGDTRQQIAFEKAAIYRSGRPALTGCESSQKLLQQHTDAEVHYVPTNPDLSVGLLGAHQQHNASVALELVSRLGYRFDAESLQTLSWPARMQSLGHLVVDCAHNPHGLRVVLQAAKELNRLDGRAMEIIFGAMVDKNVPEMAKILSAAGYPIHLVEPAYPRRMPLKQLKSYFAPNQPRLHVSVDACLSSLNPRQQYLVVGSAFLAAEVLAAINGLPYPECGIVTTAR